MSNSFFMPFKILVGFLVIMVLFICFFFIPIMNDDGSLNELESSAYSFFITDSVYFYEDNL